MKGIETMKTRFQKMISLVLALVMMLLTQYFMKLGIEAFFGTPMAYAAVRWARRNVKF